jgi:hypothetical protein
LLAALTDTGYQTSVAVCLLTHAAGHRSRSARKPIPGSPGRTLASAPYSLCSLPRSSPFS